MHTTQTHANAHAQRAVSSSLRKGLCFAGLGVVRQSSPFAQLFEKLKLRAWVLLLGGGGRLFSFFLLLFSPLLFWQLALARTVTC